MVDLSHTVDVRLGWCLEDSVPRETRWVDAELRRQGGRRPGKAQVPEAQ